MDAKVVEIDEDKIDMAGKTKEQFILEGISKVS